jgi:hypothetical protein
LSLIKHKTYTAKVNFVIEENKQNAGGIFSALAGQIGLDMSSLSSSSGILAGDNVLELLKSPTLLKKVLLSSAPQDSGTSIAWVYMNSYGYHDSFQKIVGKPTFFLPMHDENINSSNRSEDSLLQIISKRIREKEMSVYKPDKKLSIFSLELTTRNEQMSQLISSRLIDQASKLFIETKTKRLRSNVERLQKKADSIAYLLNKSTYSSATKSLLNANPSYVTTEVDLEISNREKGLLSVLYGDLNKSLDISKTALIQETPTIEVIDRPELPLQLNEWKWYYMAPIGFFIGLIASVFLVTYFIPKADQ